MFCIIGIDIPRHCQGKWKMNLRDKAKIARHKQRVVVLVYNDIMEA